MRLRRLVSLKGFRTCKNQHSFLLLIHFAVFGFSLPHYSHATGSICYGTPSNGRLEKGVALIASGKNFTSYSTLGNQLGRTYVHSKVQDIVSRAYAQLETSAPNKVFVYGETGFAQGGEFRPHRSHQNGLSVDFMVPVVNKDGKSVPLPSNPINKFGYGIEFDKDGKFENLSIDFEAMAEHLYQLNLAAQQAGESLDLVIFDVQYLPKLFNTKRGVYLKSSLRFMEKTPWIRHDEHYHVDFKIACERFLQP